MARVLGAGRGKYKGSLRALSVFTIRLTFSRQRLLYIPSAPFVYSPSLSPTMLFTKALFTMFSFALVATALPTSDMEGDGIAFLLSFFDTEA